MGVHVLQVSYFGQLLFRAIALQTRELADTPNGFEGSSIAAIHSFALGKAVFRAIRYGSRGNFFATTSVS